MKVIIPRASAPAHIDRLLKSLVKSMGTVPDEADALLNRGDLPSSWLQNVVVAAVEAGHNWRCWMDGHLHVWLFIAKLSLPLSRELGSPVLQVAFYRESGLREAANWSVDQRSRWYRAPIRAGKSDDERSGELTGEEPTLTKIDFYRPDDVGT